LVPLGARLAYTLGVAFTARNSIFSLTTGSVLLYGLLAVLPEFIVVLIYTVVGLVIPLDVDSGPASVELGAYKSNSPPYAPPAQPYQGGAYNS
jgi:hypothetical protein